MNYGPNGFQPHNFVIQDGKEIKPKQKTIPKKNLIQVKDYFKWLESSKYNISYHKIQSNFEVNYYNRTNIVINTNEADSSLIMINKYNLTDDNEFELVYLVPFSGEEREKCETAVCEITDAKSQIIDLFNLGMFHILF